MIKKRESRRDILARELARSVRDYVNERENPAPDYTMRRLEYERMIGALEAYEEIP